MTRTIYKALLARATAGLNGFTGRLTFTIDHTQCGTADSTSFPVLVHETRAGLKSTGNGGFVTNANGYDIVFFADIGLTTKLDFEIESEGWNAATGDLIAHVRIPTLSHTTDTVFYLGYGKSSITTDQSNMAGVWPSFGEVHHFGNSGIADYSIGRRTDSSGNSNTLSNGASFTTPATGEIGKGLDVTNTTQVLASSSSGTNVLAGPMTCEAWVYRLADYTNYRVFLCKGSSSGANPRNYTLYTIITSGVASFQVSIGGTLKNAAGTTAIPASTWTHIAGTYDNANLRVYVNGVLEGTTAATGSLDDPAGTVMMIGCLDYGFGANLPWQGYVDEVRLSSVARDQSWMTAQYNNQKAASTFYTVT
jgi:hypothetical protein